MTFEPKIVPGTVVEGYKYTVQYESFDDYTGRYDSSILNTRIYLSKLDAQNKVRDCSRHPDIKINKMHKTLLLMTGRDEYCAITDHGLDPNIPIILASPLAQECTEIDGFETFVNDKFYKHFESLDKVNIAAEKLKESNLQLTSKLCKLWVDNKSGNLIAQ